MQMLYNMTILDSELPVLQYLNLLVQFLLDHALSYKTGKSLKDLENNSIFVTGKKRTSP